MTEKYFKYLIKQSLPLFGIILIGGSFFVTGLINLDNLPAYVFLLSAGVPFLFELSRYHKKSAYFYSSLPIEQKNLWIARIGCVQFLFQIPSLLFLFAMICRHSLSFSSMLHLVLAWTASLFLVTSLILLIFSFCHTLLDAVIIFANGLALPTFLINTIHYLTKMNMQFGYTAPVWLRNLSPWQRMFEMMRESVWQMDYGWSGNTLGNGLEYGIAVLMGSLALLCLLFKVSRFRSEEAGRLSSSRRMLVFLIRLDTFLLLLVMTWKPILEWATGLFYAVFLICLLYFGGLMLAKQRFKVTVKEVLCLLILILTARGVNLAYRSLCYRYERLSVQRMNEVALEFYVYPNKGGMIPENLSCYIELAGVKDPLVLNELRGWMKVTLDEHFKDSNYYEYEDWNDDESRTMQVRFHDNQSLSYDKNIPVDLLSNSQVVQLFYKQNLPEGCYLH